MSNKYGYSRVSHFDQNPERQLDSLKQCNVVYIYSDVITGYTADRPELNKLLHILKEGDEVHILSFDRLARNLLDLRNIVNTIISKGARLISVKENITFTGDDSPANLLLLSVMGAVAEFERAFIRERQKEGILLAKSRGAFKGGTRKLCQEDRDYLYDAIDRGVPKTEIAKRLKIAKGTVYSYIALREQLKKSN
jgi:DNA invertase Pin-like site-specific DNA recombinase